MPVKKRSNSFKNFATARASKRASRGWLAFFALWTVLLTGVFSRFTGAPAGSPGVIQWWRLSNLEATRNTELAKIEIEVELLERTANLIDQSPRVLEREIRRTLGYVADDELILDIKDQN